MRKINEIKKIPGSSPTDLFVIFRRWLVMRSEPGANPTIVSYNASVVKFYNTSGSTISSSLQNALAYYNAGVANAELPDIA
jgi:hypothetical protein